MYEKQLRNQKLLNNQGQLKIGIANAIEFNPQPPHCILYGYRIPKNTGNK